MVNAVAARNGHAPSQVAIAWTLRNLTVTSPIGGPEVDSPCLIGARTLQHLEDNLGALDVTVTEQDVRDLEQVSGIELGFPHHFLNLPMTRSVMFGDIRIEPAPSPR